jgi:hypothetical protein
MLGPEKELEPGCHESGNVGQRFFRECALPPLVRIDAA